MLIKVGFQRSKISLAKIKTDASGKSRQIHYSPLAAKYINIGIGKISYMLDATKSSTPKKITVELTMHSIARLHDRISFLRESNDNELLSKLNSQLKEGLLRNNSKTAAYRLGYEGLKYEFVLAKNSDAYFKAVTFKNMWHVWCSGKEVEVTYVIGSVHYFSNPHQSFAQSKPNRI